MKKIICLVVAIVFMLTMLVGCGNMSIGPGNFSFKKVHVDTHHQNKCFTIQSWRDDERGIEVNTKEAGSMFLSEGVYMLIEDECPFCDVEAEVVE